MCLLFLCNCCLLFRSRLNKNNFSTDQPEKKRLKNKRAGAQVRVRSVHVQIFIFRFSLLVLSGPILSEVQSVGHTAAGRVTQNTPAERFCSCWVWAGPRQTRCVCVSVKQLMDSCLKHDGECVGEAPKAELPANDASCFSRSETREKTVRLRHRPVFYKQFRGRENIQLRGNDRTNPSVRRPGYGLSGVGYCSDSARRREFHFNLILNCCTWPGVWLDNDINDKITNICLVPEVLQTEQHDCSLAGVLSLSFIRGLSAEVGHSSSVYNFSTF